MDTLAPTLPPSPATVTVEQADGWIVVSKFMRPRPVVPPYQYDYSHSYYDHLGDAHDHYNEIERGEFDGWLPVAIIPCKRGVPLGSKAVL